jgi:hypothetical protein
LRCHYKAHLTTRPDQKKLYITALEGRVAQLESLLSTLGHDGVGVDHWKEEQSQLQDDFQLADISQAEDLSVDSSTRVAPSFDANKSISPSGRFFSSVIKAQISPKPHTEDENGQPTLVSRSDLVERMGKMFVSPTTASKLMDTWVKHFSTHYPVTHSHRLKDLHTRRDGVLDVFQESILHLVYAISGCLLEAVSVMPTAEMTANLTVYRQARQANSTQPSTMMLHYRT